MKNERIIIVDTLRGFALLLIILIHFVEHFNLEVNPDFRYLFSAHIDEFVSSKVSFLIDGKAYSIFAFLFGFSFYIQMSRKEQVGVDFRLRFLWRLAILFFIGMINSMFYLSDFLHIYAIFGLLMLALYKVKTRSLWWIAILLIAQIPMIVQIFSFIHPMNGFVIDIGSKYFDIGNSIYLHGSLYDVFVHNIWHGKVIVWGWMLSQGRLLQIPALFITGFIVGRMKIFEEIGKYQKNLIKMLFISIIAMVILTIIMKSISYFNLLNEPEKLLTFLFGSYRNIAFSIIIVSVFVLLYLKYPQAYIYKIFALYGKMSLTNYVMQCIFGVVFFYGFGFGMYRYLGTTWSLIIGLVVFTIQAFVSMWWIKRFYYGPLEWLWRALTFLDFKTKFARRDNIQTGFNFSNIPISNHSKIE